MGRCGMTQTAERLVVRPGVAWHPAPRCEPPFDDEPAPAAWVVAEQLSLPWPEAEGGGGAVVVRAAPEGGGAPEDRNDGPVRGVVSHGRDTRRPPDSRAVQRDASRRGLDDPVGAVSFSARTPAAYRPQRSPIAGASHDAKLAVHRFVRVCVEVLSGHRPPAHLRRLSLPAQAADVVAEGLSAVRRVAALRRAACRPGRRPPRRIPPVAVIRLRLCEPRPGAVEAAVALVTGDRTCAMALRLELHQDAWHATTLRVL